MIEELMTTIAEKRSEMPSGTHVILNRRSLEHGNEYLLPFLREGMDVLDVGCGTGAITKGIVDHVGPSGKVTGMDKNEPLIRRAENEHSHIPNLSFVVADVATAVANKRYDVINTARTLQWLSDSQGAINRMRTWLKPGGRLFILDYNHTKIEWMPEPPASMRHFYKCFLDWRADAGMNNTIADDLSSCLQTAGLMDIEGGDASESASNESSDFAEVAGIWGEVATTRGVQMVEDGFLSEDERLRAIHEYDAWLNHEGISMKMYLLYVTGRCPE